VPTIVNSEGGALDESGLQIILIHDCHAALSLFTAKQDLMQFADRYKWYEAKFAADDMPDWTAGSLVSVAQQGAGVRLVTLLVGVCRPLDVPSRQTVGVLQQLLERAHRCGGMQNIPEL
jgi:hypothetical protein